MLDLFQECAFGFALESCSMQFFFTEKRIKTIIISIDTEKSARKVNIPRNTGHILNLKKGIKINLPLTSC